MNNKLPEYFFVDCCDGHLFDTRDPNWSRNPLRKHYHYCHPLIDTPSKLAAFIRRGSCTSIGGYEIYLIDNKNGEAISYRSVKKYFADFVSDMRNDPQLTFSPDINWEDPLLIDAWGVRIGPEYEADDDE